MSESTIETPEESPAAAAIQEETPDQAAETAESTDGHAPADEEDIPNVIKALREDFKQERAKRQAAERKAENAVKDFTQTIGKALGLVNDDAPVDPVVLTQNLADSQADAKHSKVQLAVFRTAREAGGDAEALLDSASFLKSVHDIDPSDTVAISAAIAEAVTANPRLGVIEQRTGMRPNPAQGSSAAPPLTTAQRIAAAQEAGDLKTAMRLKASQALNANP
jgi:hypothetical protein